MVHLIKPPVAMGREQVNPPFEFRLGQPKSVKPAKPFTIDAEYIEE